MRPDDWHLTEDLAGFPARAGDFLRSRPALHAHTFGESPDGTALSMAGMTSTVACQIRGDPDRTPAQLRGRGYAGAVTVEVSRAAPAAGAAQVVLFAGPANLTSNGLHQRIGYVPVADFAVYDFSCAAPGAGRTPGDSAAGTATAGDVAGRADCSLAP